MNLSRGMTSVANPREFKKQLLHLRPKLPNDRPSATYCSRRRPQSQLTIIRCPMLSLSPFLSPLLSLVLLIYLMILSRLLRKLPRSSPLRCRCRDLAFLHKILRARCAQNLIFATLPHPLLRHFGVIGQLLAITWHYSVEIINFYKNFLFKSSKIDIMSSPNYLAKLW